MSGCEGQNVKENGTTIVCTIFPIYDWVCEVTEGAEDVNVILLSENGADMHSFQPTVKNVIGFILVLIGGILSNSYSKELIKTYDEYRKKNK